MHMYKKMPMPFTVTTAKLTEFPLCNCHTAKRRTPFSLIRTFCSLKTRQTHNTPLPKTPQNPTKTSNTAAPWLKKWPALEANSPKDGNLRGTHVRNLDKNVNGGNPSAIDRIVLRLRNLDLDSDDDEDEDGEDGVFSDEEGEGEKLGDLLKRDWIRNDAMLVEEEGRGMGRGRGGGGGEDDMVLLPWERESGKEGERGERGWEGREKMESGVKKSKKAVRAPTLADLTIETAELKRLRGKGMVLRDKVNVPKAGLTQAVLEKIHNKWRKSELVRLKFHEDLARDMRTAHILVERRTGGLIIWRAGSVMIVYRGINYAGPPPKSLPGEDVSSVNATTISQDNVADATAEDNLSQVKPQNLTAEEIEYNNLLDGLGPRFFEWWGTGLLPVDADLLPQTIPDFMPPLRLLPAGLRVSLTNAELANLRQLAKTLPCHFALGRNRNHQGLAAAIIKLWEKSLVAKIAVKRGIQNTNNELMAEELKKLTGGTLLLRNKFFIVIYRGKDFLPPSVAAAVEERQVLAKQIQDAEERARSGSMEATVPDRDGEALAGTLAEFYEAQSRWGREVSAEELAKMREEASNATTVKEVKQIEHKLALAQSKLLRAEKLLAKVQATMVRSDPSDDLETITDEERFTFRKIGIRMKAYLPVGIRGIFDGVIENMHLHWKHRELVKLITKQKTLSFVEDTARLLEYESGGILVSIDRVPKGYVLIYYRGKNYQRPISLRPRNLLTKAKAFKRAIALQRHEGLSQHIAELEKNIYQLKKEMGYSEDSENEDDLSSDGEYDPTSEMSQSDNEDSHSEFGHEEYDDPDYENDEDLDNFDYDADEVTSDEEDAATGEIRTEDRDGDVLRS